MGRGLFFDELDLQFSLVPPPLLSFILKRYSTAENKHFSDIINEALLLLYLLLLMASFVSNE